MLPELDWSLSVAVVLIAAVIWIAVRLVARRRRG
jgi:hypothetical protein